MDPASLGIFKAKLAAARAKATERIEGVEKAAEFDRPESEWSGELSSYDNHTGDSSSALEMRSISLGLINHGEDTLAQIDAALDRVESGTYGKCVRCGIDIPEERLHAIPWAASCAECGARSPSPVGTGTSRPIEEEVIRPPFGGRSTAHAYDDPGIHGEDIWDELAEYGTANSPQDEESFGSGGPDAR
ncbi:MAG: TraR/DksA C4-type zinc finger protein [Clostridia bacterium]|nr:TraR/DksA C4-type zinc finger protein [Clostridia bacterium]